MTALVDDRSRLKDAVLAVRTPVLAFVTALAVGAVIMLVSDRDASLTTVTESYEALFRSSLGSSKALGRTLVETAPLAFGGLSVALAFKAGLFNIGASGQLLMGALFATYVGISWDLPAVVHLPLALLAGFAGGFLFGAIPGWLKARTGAHEVITTIMLNFVALRLVDYALSTDTFLRPGRRDPISPPVAESARLPATGGELDVHLGFLLALAAAAAVWYLLYRTTIGFRLRTVGANPHAATYAGMSVAGTYVLAMGLAGGLAGWAGTSNLLGRESYSLTGGFFAFIGFDAIAVALLARSNPYGVIASAFLFGALRSGGQGMQAATAISIDLIVVIQALIIAFVAAPALIRAIYRIRAERGLDATFSTGWGAS